MPKSLILGAVSALGLAAAASAEVPSVAVDIPPVHSLVARVMDGVGTPDLLVQPGASPHGYALRPSEASALGKADVVFWVGEALDPWLIGPIKALAADARSVELMETDGTTELEFREGATFEAHGHDDEDHADHDHDHHGHDPHAWLDPENARVWLNVIAAELSSLDPENAATYQANAEAGRAELATLIEEISTELSPVRGQNFVVFHDAYQYFESRFDFPAAGSITLSDASAPSPARIEEIQQKVRDLGVTCAFSEPQFNPGLVATVFRGIDAQTGVMDPLGAALTPGPDLYPQMLRNLADSLAECLG